MASNPLNVQEFYEMLKRMTPYDATPRLAGMEVTLSTTTTSASDTYQVPSDKDFYVLEISTYHRFTLVNTEAAMAAAIGTNLLPRERAAMKLQNVVWTLKDQERAETDIMKGDPPHMGMHAPELRATPLSFRDSPIIFPGGSKLEATFTVKDTTALVIGVASAFGIICQGVLLPKRAA